MPRYTDAQRQKSIETRKRNAKRRREERERLGYNPSNPPVKLTDNLVVTQAVEKRLAKQAKGATHLSIIEIFLVVISFIFITICFAARPFTVMNFIFLIPAIIAWIIYLTLRSKRVKANTRELAQARKELIEERKQFYSSPEWRQVRTQVIRENGRICSECGLHIHASIDVTVDHIKPRSKYPELALTKNNLRVLCRSCNSRKGDDDSELILEVLK